MLVASLLDLAATKVKLVQDRAETKDYLDLAAALSHGIDLARAVAAASAIYGERFNPVPSLKALCYTAEPMKVTSSARRQARPRAAPPGAKAKGPDGPARRLR